MTEPTTVPTVAPHRRSAYADRLAAFGDVALDGEAVHARRGMWAAHFATRVGPAFGGRIVLDIGCFDASVLTAMAAREPGTAFIGIDWKAKAILDGATRIASLGVRNALLLRARAQDIALIFAAGEIDEAILFHPEPCDRPNEIKHRLVSEAFLLDVGRVLRDERSSLSIKTDHPGYYQHVLSLLGLPEPEAIARARAGLSPVVGSPARRVRVRDLTDPADLPASSGAVRQAFEVVGTSADFWHDTAAQAAAAGRPFGGLVTPYESRFRARRGAIYFLSLRKRPAA